MSDIRKFYHYDFLIPQINVVMRLTNAFDNFIDILNVHEYNFENNIK